MDSHAEIETVLSAASPAHRDDALALAGSWFEASTAAGALRLYAASAARNAAEAAVVLDRCEPLLDALDEWIGPALEWRWNAAPASVTATASHARAHWQPEDAPASAGLGMICRLELPWSLLQSLPAPTGTLAGLHWSAVSMVLVISQMGIAPDELALLEPGGAVVLRESMLPTWQGRLRSLDEPARAGVGAPVALPGPTKPRRVRSEVGGAGVAQSDDEVLVEVRLEPPHAIACDRLAPWFEGELGEFHARASLWRCSTQRAPARFLAAGQLMPWGDGWALAVEAVYEPHERSARVVQ